jgi:hypothetical protein
MLVTRARPQAILTDPLSHWRAEQIAPVYAGERFFVPNTYDRTVLEYGLHVVHVDTVLIVKLFVMVDITVKALKPHEK